MRERERERNREKQREREGLLEDAVLGSEVLPNDVGMVSVLAHVIVDEGVLVIATLSYHRLGDVVRVHGFPELLDQHGSLPLHFIHLGLQRTCMATKRSNHHTQRHSP